MTDNFTHWKLTVIGLIAAAFGVWFLSMSYAEPTSLEEPAFPAKLFRAGVACIVGGSTIFLYGIYVGPLPPGPSH